MDKPKGPSFLTKATLTAITLGVAVGLIPETERENVRDEVMAALGDEEAADRVLLRKNTMWENRLYTDPDFAGWIPEADINRPTIEKVNPTLDEMSASIGMKLSIWAANGTYADLPKISAAEYQRALQHHPDLIRAIWQDYQGRTGVQPSELRTQEHMELNDLLIAAIEARVPDIIARGIADQQSAGDQLADNPFGI